MLQARENLDEILPWGEDCREACHHVLSDAKVVLRLIVDLYPICNAQDRGSERAAVYVISRDSTEKWGRGGRGHKYKRPRAGLHDAVCRWGTGPLATASEKRKGKEKQTIKGSEREMENVLPDVMQEVLRCVDKATHEAVCLQLLCRVIGLDRIGIEVLVERAPVASPPGTVALDGERPIKVRAERFWGSG